MLGALLVPAFKKIKLRSQLLGAEVILHPGPCTRTQLDTRLARLCRRSICVGDFGASSNASFYRSS